MVDGYFLNNELTDFNIVPDRDGKPTANRRGGQASAQFDEPGHRLRPGGPCPPCRGAAGGATIPTQVIRMLVGTLDWGMDARSAITMGVIMPMPDGIAVEAGSNLEPMIPRSPQWDTDAWLPCRCGSRPMRSSGPRPMAGRRSAQRRGNRFALNLSEPETRLAVTASLRLGIGERP
jgi:hypothetical protein